MAFIFLRSDSSSGLRRSSVSLIEASFSSYPGLRKISCRLSEIALSAFRILSLRSRLRSVARFSSNS